MIVGVPKEIKDNEYRVALVPSGVRQLKGAGHTILVEAGAGEGSGIGDKEYEKEGAGIVKSAKEAFSSSDIVIKVKEPQPSEYQYLREGLILFTFLHLATKKDLAVTLINKKTTAIAYETVETDSGDLPVLKPMSEVAGRLSVEIGAHFLLKPCGGRGVLLSGVPGVEGGNVVILGAGTVGLNAVRISMGLGAETTAIDISTERFRRLDDIYRGRVKTLISNSYNIEKAVLGCDLLIGAAHRPGGKTPCLVGKSLVKRMKKGSVIVDVAVDQGGCVETIRPTTHSNPTYEADGVIHYGVSNIPGAVPRTSTFALTNATLPYLLILAKEGLERAIEIDPALSNGVNIHRGKVCHRAVAEALGMEHTPLA
ncbi:MAG: alanine dehydrogenase [Deltaproteobacteria bacterium]|nr:alanine dehydrogenase [Deltaproteobacteria bacterium]